MTKESDANKEPKEGTSRTFRIALHMERVRLSKETVTRNAKQMLDVALTKLEQSEDKKAEEEALDQIEDVVRGMRTALNLMKENNKAR